MQLNEQLQSPRRERRPRRSGIKCTHFMQIVTEGNDLEGIEPSKSFRNAEDSVPYGTIEESDKLQFVRIMGGSGA